MYRAIFLLTLAAHLQAQDWVQWRGPARTGVAAGFKLPVKWPARLDRIWTTPTGTGYSTPIATAAAIFDFSRDGEQEAIQAIDRATGKRLWRHAYPTAFKPNQYATAAGRGPNSTPLYHDGRVYTLGITSILSCLDAKTGALLWRKDFSSRVRTDNLFAGTAMSPLIDSGQLIATIGDDTKGGILALDPATGATRWSWEEDGAGYASPVIAEWDGVRQLVTLTGRRGVGISVKDGRLLWSIDFKDQWNENIVTPVIHGSRVIFSGVRRGTIAVDVRHQGAQWKAAPAWQNAELTMYMSSPVLDGNYLYGMSSKKKGQLFCLDVSTGKLLWTTTGREGTNLSLTSAGGQLLLLNESGQLKIARHSPAKFELVAELEVAESATWAQPLLLGGTLLIRDAAALTLYRLP